MNVDPASPLGSALQSALLQYACETPDARGSVTVPVRALEIMLGYESSPRAYHPLSAPTIISAERVGERLDVLGLTANNASLQAGLGRDYVRDILRGRIKNPSVSAMRGLADVLQCEAEALLCLDGEGIAARKADPERAHKADIIAQIGRLLEATELSGPKLARLASVAPSTVHRALDPNGPFIPNSRTMFKLSEAAARYSQSKGRHGAEPTPT